MNAIERDYALSALRTQGGQRKAGTSASFWGMAAALAGGGSVQPALGMDLTAQGTGQVQGATLEEMLKNRYGNVTYHVFDASSPYWRTRNDYPHYLLYQEGEQAKETLENWQPQGPNPFYGSVDGRFTAPEAIRALSGIPAGRTAVVIHPEAQKRMEEDPAYAAELMERIDTWFAFDAARNEAVMPGITARSSRCVAIGADGEIVNAQSFSHGEITVSSSGGDSSSRRDWTDDWWTLRMARQADFMALLVESQLEHSARLSGWLADSSAAELAQMLNGGGLEEILGDTVGGNSTAAILAQTRARVLGI